MRAGVIGLGTTGSGLAANLIANGFEATGLDPSEVHTVGFRGTGCTPPGSVAEVADRSDAFPATEIAGDQAKLAILDDVGSGIETMYENRAISLDLAEELELPMQMASTDMQILRPGQSECPQGVDVPCTRVIEEIVCAEPHGEGAK